MIDKIAKDVPSPPELTPELTKKLVEEGLKMAREIQEKARSMHQLTAEDWLTLIK